MVLRHIKAILMIYDLESNRLYCMRYSYQNRSYRMTSNTRLPKHIVKVRTIHQECSWNLLTDNNLVKMKVCPADIVRIDSFISVPGGFYTEPGVASSGHPLAVSVGVWVYTKNGHRASVQDLLSYDYNIKQTQFNGLPHWNHNRRIIDVNGSEKPASVEIHRMRNSDWLEIEFEGQKKIVKKKP